MSDALDAIQWLSATGLLNQIVREDLAPALAKELNFTSQTEIESLRAKLAASKGRVKALGDAMDKIHAKVMVEYPEVIYDIADKALALIDCPDSEVSKGEK